MKDIFVVSDNIISPIGFTTEENFKELKKNGSGIRLHGNQSISSQPFYASLFPESEKMLPFRTDDALTMFEKLLIRSVETALAGSGIPVAHKRTALIVSTTKGNISLLESEKKTSDLIKRMALSESAKRVASHFNMVTQPLVVSNACISGLLAIVTGTRLIRSGQYDHAIITGADLITQFVLSGFQSFLAVSPEPCRPFDKNRSGISLGEGAATIILSADKKSGDDVRVMGGATSNDANHISGPSRTGAELSQAIEEALTQSQKTASDIDYISAHGTATLYNDEMEAKAISLSSLERVPVNSLKGYFGHTLGAAGLIESVITIQQMKHSLVLPSKGFEENGVSNPVNIISTLAEQPLDCSLKIASGFGGCNGAIVFSKT